jgi:predicted small lipoprotein YifL
MEEKDRQTRWISGTLVLILILLFSWGCGRKGDPIAPEDRPPKENNLPQNQQSGPE